MLGLVKEPRTEICLSGAGENEVLAYLQKHFEVQLLDDSAVANSDSNDDELVEITATNWWRENQFHVLEGCRLENEMTQKQLAERSGISQTIICAYEKGKREITPKAAIKLAKALNTFPEKFLGKRR